MTMRKQSHLWKYIIPVLSLAACYVIWWLVEDNRSDYKLNQLKKEMEDRREVFFEKENPNHQFSEEETAELTDFLITNMQVHDPPLASPPATPIGKKSHAEPQSLQKYL